jgi:flagellar biosynthesis/type III secretory pathway chaperone
MAASQYKGAQDLITEANEKKQLAVERLVRMTEKEQELIGNLVRIFESLLAIYRRLVVLEKSKHEILRNRQLEKLRTVVEEEKMLADKIQLYEAERLRIQNDLPDSAANFSELLKIVAGPMQQQVMLIGLELRSVVAEIALLNQTNNWVITQLSNYLNYNFDRKRRVATTSLYNCDGQDDHLVISHRLVDKKV